MLYQTALCHTQESGFLSHHLQNRVFHVLNHFSELSDLENTRMLPVYSADMNVLRVVQDRNISLASLTNRGF